MNTDQTPIEVDWTPMQKSGAMLEKYALLKMGDDRLDFMPSRGFILLSFSLLLGGLFILIRLIFYFHSDDNPYISLITGILSTSVGVYLLFIHNNRIIFMFVDGKWRICKNNVFLRTATFLPYKPLRAIQVLEKRYYSTDYYELNIVYEDGSRESILNQRAHDSVAESATVLEQSMGIPLQSR